MKRRAAVEPVIGQLKAEHRMSRNYLKGRNGDRAIAVLAAAGTTSPSSCAGSGGCCARPISGAHPAAQPPTCLKYFHRLLHERLS
jgi:hypothetical protein